MDGFPDITLLSGWTFASFVGMAVVMAVVKGALVPGPTHEAMRTDRDYYRDKLREQTNYLLTNVQAYADLQTVEKLSRGFAEKRDPGATP